MRQIHTTLSYFGDTFFDKFSMKFHEFSTRIDVFHDFLIFSCMAPSSYFGAFAPPIRVLGLSVVHPMDDNSQSIGTVSRDNEAMPANRTHTEYCRNKRCLHDHRAELQHFPSGNTGECTPVTNRRLTLRCHIDLINTVYT